MKNQIYFVVELEQSERFQEIIDIAMSQYQCQGVEEYSLEEESVDKILGTRSYSGGNPSSDVLEDIESSIANKISSYKYYFYDKKTANSFKAFVDQTYPNIKNKLCTFEYEDWNLEWKNHYNPIKISDKLEIIPSWMKEDYNSSTPNPIYIYPGQGFGTGNHETTFLCLKLMMDISNEQISSCLDFGTGSGILGISALNVFNLKDLILYDIDRDAIENTKQNLNLNLKNHLKKNISTLLEKDKNKIRGKYDLVFANILAPVLIQEAGFLIEHTSKYLILSGILKEQSQEVLEPYKNMKLLKEELKGDWSAFLLSKGDVK